MNPFDFINAITLTKKNLIAEDELVEKEYNPFIVNRGLSYFQDTVYQANEMNRYHHLDKKLQFEFLLNIVRPRKRFSKWFKKEEADSELELVKEYYGYNDQKAQQALSILNDDALKYIRTKMEKGGKR